jgi:flagellar basal-body rod modification protein FlgD
MAVSSVNNFYGSAAGEAVNRTANSELDKEAFLRLLIAELTNQDPTQPMEDREFIAQMAQFSALEQMTNISKQLEGFSVNNQAQAVGYVGRMVVFETENAEGAPQEVASMVLAVWFDPNEGTILETELGQVPMKKIIGVA